MFESKILNTYFFTIWLMNKEYYFISDLHLGADEFRKTCPFEYDLIKFLKTLQYKTNKTELIIVGDMFGFWELNKNIRNKSFHENKLQYIISFHKSLFEQFKKTGENILITLVPGNHDYELFDNKVYEKILKQYNIVISKSERILKTIHGKKIWIEHGHQYDEYNKTTFHEYDDDLKPLSYFVTKEILSTINSKKQLTSTWIRDIQSVQPREDIPNWLWSNYFYRELHPILKFIAVPFLLFFTFSFFVLLAGYLKQFGLIEIPVLTFDFSQHFGIFGDVFNIIIFIDTICIMGLFLLFIPLLFLYKDFKHTFVEFGFTTENFKAVKQEKYIDAAKKVFEKNPDISFFVFGHIHSPFIQAIDKDKVIINTGTWIKKLKRIKPSKIFLLPSIYYPHYKLTIIHIFEKNKQIVVTNNHIDKKTANNFTWLQKFALFFTRKHKHKTITEISINV